MSPRPIARATITIRVNGQPLDVDAQDSLAAALLNAGVGAFRTSRSGEPRGPVCGMGICFECRVRVDGTAHVRSCMEPVRAGMEVETGD